MTTEKQVETALVFPDFYRIFERKVDGKWYLHPVEHFYSRLPFLVDPDDFKLRYGLSNNDVAIGLFRVNGGKAGFYIANLKDKKYYYCGEEFDWVKQKFLSLGIGRVDPMG